MTTVYGLSGINYQLAPKLFSSGGEGDIFSIINDNSQVTKIYHAKSITPELEQKLMHMVKKPPSSKVLTQVAWPIDVIYDSQHSFCGFVMPKLSITDELLELYKYPPSKYQNVTIKQKLIVAENICAVISEVHRAGYVFGDFNPRNIGLNVNTGMVAFLDTDSYHIILNKSMNSAYRCKVCLDGYVAPELLVKIDKEGLTQDAYALASLDTFTQDTDNFALAIHIFKLLMNGYTPFNGIKEMDSVSQASPGVGNVAVKRDSYCFKPGNKPQSVAVPQIDALPQEITDLFTRAFIIGRIDPKLRPTAVDWHSALVKYENSLKRCNRNLSHQFYNGLTSCPWCEADARYNSATAPIITQRNYGVPPLTYTPPVAQPPQYIPTTLPTKLGTGHGSARPKSGLITVVAVVVIILVGFFVLRGILDSSNSMNNNYTVVNQQASSQQTKPPTSSQTPNSKVNIPFDNPTVTLQSSTGNSIPDGKGTIIVQLLGGGSPIAGKQIDIYNAVQSIAGQWAIEKNYYSKNSDISGFVSKDIPPGNYIVKLPEYSGRVYGTYGIIGRSDNDDIQAIPIYVKYGEIVYVTISLAKLEVGILSSDGKKALSGEYVGVLPQGVDIAGNPIPLGREEGFALYPTSAAGTVIWYLGAGTYVIDIKTPWSSGNEQLIYDIHIVPGEEKKLIFNRSK